MEEIKLYTPEELQARDWKLTVTAAGALYTANCKKTFTDEYTGQQIAYAQSYTGLPTQTVAYDVLCAYASAIEYGTVAEHYAPAAMFFPKEDLYQWISPQTLKEFEHMNPNCVEQGYNSALSYLISQLGELYDIDAILRGESNRETIQILRWVLSVLTAYNASSPTMKHSQVMLDNRDMAIEKVTEMKTGFSTIKNAPIIDEPTAWGGVVNFGKRKMLG